MAQYSRKEVLDAAKKLADMLANTEEIDRFKELEAKINASTKIQTLITKIKALQKQAVNLQAYDKKEALARVEEQLDRLQSELDGIPIVSEFKELQVTVNDVLQLVSTTISREVTNRIIEGTGGNVLEGKTGTKVTK
ncbi:MULTISPECIES: RicAFT regulatory complex protein RicA family protein [unclassified Oceanobacillus]|uniref:RicAFT regulatory complex protein RicA family protein n=1 Tax=unclassified Oceanobacillus TaxID=2630292 RepID=UPI0012EBB320|nr:YlbF family regulator [Oceanobacillus sp. AG]